MRLILRGCHRPKAERSPSSSRPLPNLILHSFDKAHETTRKKQMRVLNKRTAVQYNEESLVRAQLKALEQRKRDLVRSLVLVLVLGFSLA